MTIAHVSDLHLGAYSPTAAARLVEDVAAVAPDVTVVTGDLTMRARHRQFRAAAALITELPGPRLLVPGNHDIPLDNPILRLAHPFERYLHHLGVALQVRLDVPGLRVLGINSMPRWRWKSGRVDRRQCADLVEVLGGAPPGTVRVLALHHPVGRYTVAGLLGRRRLLAALADARVDLVLAGHTHLPRTQRLELPTRDGTHPVVEVVAGTATSTRTRRVGRSWALIRIDSDAITVEHRYLDAPGGRPASAPVPRPAR